jgi:hypothetical protein
MGNIFKNWKQISIVACALIAVVFSLFQFATKEPSYPPGFCKDRQRYISDEELIKNAAQARDERTSGTKKYAKRDFDQANSNCCRVLRGEDNLEISKRFQFEVVAVELNNETSVANIKGYNKNDRVVLNNCGEIVAVYLDFQGR